MRPDGPRDAVAGPDAGPQPPFPLRLDGKVIKGFGRGSKEVSLRARDVCTTSRGSVVDNTPIHSHRRHRERSASASLSGGTQ